MPSVARFVPLHLYLHLSLPLSIRITLGGLTAVPSAPRSISHHFPYLLPAALCFPRQPYVRVFSEYLPPFLSLALTSPPCLFGGAPERCRRRYGRRVPHITEKQTARSGSKVTGVLEMRVSPSLR